MTTKIEIVVEGGTVTADHLAQMAADAGVSVVDTSRSHVDRAAGEQARQALPTAQNAVETAALRSFRQRSGQKIGPTQWNATVVGTGDTPEPNGEFREHMTDEQTELVKVRDRFDTELSELGAAISEIQEHLDAIDENIATAIMKRDTAVEAFLPDDQVPQPVTTENRDAIVSYLDTLGEKRDVQRETMAMKNDRLKAETKRAGDIRDDIDETAAAIDRLGERTDEAKSRVDDARQELDARLRSFRSETVAQAAGRVEDRQANVEDLQADLEEERTELTEAKKERDETDVAVARLESEIGTLVAEIDRLQAKTDQGEACLAAFEVVDELRAQRKELVEELRELQAESAEKEAERASLNAEIEALTDE